MLTAALPDIQETSLAAAPLNVGRATLTCFRNYHDACLHFTADPVVLTGANGSGKTNFLEAISLLVPGRGLRRSAHADLQNRHAQKPWAVAVELRAAFGPLHIGTGRDPADTDNDPVSGHGAGPVSEHGAGRRIVHIDGKNARSQNVLAEHVAMAWITPDMDRLLAEGTSARRKFLDRLVYSFDPAHSGRAHRYEKALRERMRLLREGPRDAFWLNGLEDEMAQTGVAIAAARRHLLQQLRMAIGESDGAFPRADIELRGMAEDALEHNPALPVEDMLRAALARSRDDDARNGTTSAGPHRSDLAVRHRARNCPAELCSTGEQKALLIAIMLAYVRVLTRHRQLTPLILLDDITAHLDDLRRAALFDELLALGVQAWLTGTDAGVFAPLLPYAQHFDVEQGNLSQS
jgi:DNA replication and repair protein RecF